MNASFFGLLLLYVILCIIAINIFALDMFRILTCDERVSLKFLTVANLVFWPLCAIVLHYVETSGVLFSAFFLGIVTCVLLIIRFDDMKQKHKDKEPPYPGHDPGY